MVRRVVRAAGWRRNALDGLHVKAGFGVAFVVQLLVSKALDFLYQIIMHITRQAVQRVVIRLL
jgi:hypothetical protein